MRAARVGAALVALAVLAGACGADDDAGGGAGSPAAEVGGGPDGEPAPSSGCGNEAGFATGFSHQTIDSGGGQRTYRLLVPDTHDGDAPVPLLLSLAGYTSDAALQEAISQYEDLGAAEGYVVATPEPLNEAWDVGEGSADVVFMTDLLDALEGGLCVDRSRVYASGLSLGAIFSSRLACDLGDRLAAIGPVAGLSFPPGCDPGHAMPVLSIHGTIDGLVSFDTGLEGFHAWAEHNGCAGDPVDEQIGQRVVVSRYEEGCDAPVELWVVNGGGHSWPGAELLVGVSPSATTTEIDASELIWEFFQRFQLASEG